MNGFLKKHGFKHGITTRSNDEKALKTNRGAIQASLLELLQIAGIPAGSDIGDEDKYKKWKVVDEPCLDEISEFCKHMAISCSIDGHSTCVYIYADVCHQGDVRLFLGSWSLTRTGKTKSSGFSKR